MTNRAAEHFLAFGLLVGALTLGGVLAAPAFADEHGHDNGRHRGRSGYHHRDDYRSHDIYDGAPPVVVAPQGYYAQPGAALTLSLPFFR